MLARRAAPLLVLVLSLSCSPTSTGGTALRVAINLEPGLASRCVLLELTDPATARVLVTSQGTPTTMRAMLQAAVFRNALPATVSLRAVGFTDANCMSATAPAEVSEVVEATFPTPPTLLRDVSLTVKANGSMMSVDLDGDGSPAGVDCDDRDARRKPGLAEDCTDGKDNDCNQLSDCGDGVCMGLLCRGAGTQCQGSVCVETLCDDGFDNDGDTRVDCADTDCNARPCMNGGTCAAGTCGNAQSERNLCADGIDNDNDSVIDCLDTDCNQLPCSDGVGCTTGETCQARVCAGGQQVVCPSSTNACEASMGQCQEPDGGCVYAKAPTTTGCDDGVRCTEADRCDGDGGCQGTPLQCMTPPAGDCWETSGRCIEADGGCRYEVAVGRQSCADSDLCTVNDACLEDGGCLGSPLDCSGALPPSECLVATGGCDAGACLFVPRTGSCDGGSCAGGVCVAFDAGLVDAGLDAGSSDAGVAPDAGQVDSGVIDASTPDAGPAFIIPSNVPVQVIESAPSTAHLDITCNVTLSLNPVALTGSGGGCQAPTLAAPVIVPQANAPTLYVFVMDRLTARSGARLRIVRGSMGQPADRTVVLAVKGDATIDGTIDVSAFESGNSFESGPGGNGAYCPSVSPGGQQNNRSGGGQGGGFGLGGGSGGDGANNGGDGAPGRPANGNATLVPLRGGCGGSVGGGGAADRFGRAGGSLQLWVQGQLTVNGSLLANGGRGLSSQTSGGGGGGGGSGGGLLVEATRVTVGSSAIVAANGGSGAEGSSFPAYGDDGEPGTIGVTPAPGGTGSNECGGFGGRGGAEMGGATSGQEGGVENGCNVGNLGGGGGGGGSVGRVRFNALFPCTIATQARLSPRPTSAQPSCAP